MWRQRIQTRQAGTDMQPEMWPLKYVKSYLVFESTKAAKRAAAMNENGQVNS